MRLGRGGFHFFIILLAICIGLAACDTRDSNPRNEKIQLEAQKSLLRPRTRLFLREERRNILHEVGVDPFQLPAIFSSKDEHGLVREAIDYVVNAELFNATEKAALWEELSSHIQRMIGHPVSESFRGEFHGQKAYIFRGTRRYSEGYSYVLVISDDGKVYSGLVDPVENPCEWRAKLRPLS